jgi:hypothetical protein
MRANLHVEIAPADLLRELTDLNRGLGQAPGALAGSSPFGATVMKPHPPAWSALQAQKLPSRGFAAPDALRAVTAHRNLGWRTVFLHIGRVPGQANPGSGEPKSLGRVPR